MKFDQRVENVIESYLTQGMQGSVKMQHAKTGVTTPQMNQNQNNPNAMTEDPDDGEDSKLFKSLMLKAAENDDPAVEDELDEYFTNLGIDKKILGNHFLNLSNKYAQNAK